VTGTAISAAPSPEPRTFTSPSEALSGMVGVLGRAGPLAAVHLRGRLDPKLRERVSRRQPGQRMPRLHLRARALGLPVRRHIR
jgi:hypothetical protein